MEMQLVPEVSPSEKLSNPDADALKLTGDNMKDLANIAKEFGVSLDTNGNIVQAPAPANTVQPKVNDPAPVQPQVAEQPEIAQDIQVPEKFQNPDGTPNAEKIEKSTLNVEDAIARYRAKERELSQLQNKVNNPPQAAPAVNQPVTQVVSPVSLSPLEASMASDLINEAAMQGVQLDQRLAIAQARVMARGLEAKHSAELSASQELRQRLEDQDRRIQLQGLFERDPSLASEDMMNKLMEVRRANPWLNSSPNPYQAAYFHMIGSNGRGAQVSTPAPLGTTAKAPPTPVSPVARVQKSINVNNTAELKSLSDKDLNALAAKMFPGNRSLKV